MKIFLEEIQSGNNGCTSYERAEVVDLVDTQERSSKYSPQLVASLEELARISPNFPIWVLRNGKLTHVEVFRLALYGERNKANIHRMNF